MVTMCMKNHDRSGRKTLLNQLYKIQTLQPCQKLCISSGASTLKHLVYVFVAKFN